MSFEATLASRSLRADPEALAELARLALARGDEERALPLLEEAVGATSDARLWQWKGLLERALDEHAKALESFAQAARLAPADASIAHGHARVALEAGVDAVPLFERARRIGRPSSDVLLGQAAAKFASGRGEEAESELDAILTEVPLWLEGHAQLAQLRSMIGKAEHALDSVHRSLCEQRAEQRLWQALFDLLVRREAHGELRSELQRAHAEGIPARLLLPYEAIAAAELGDTERADRLFEQLDATELPIWRVRHLLRSGRASEALPLIDAELESDGASEAWPYAAVAWRLTNDARLYWLAGDQSLVSVIDLRAEMPPLETLRHLLRSLHLRAGQYLDQSVRGGTQTDGPLFSRIEPEIRQLRSAVVGAVQAHLAQLPDRDSEHPTLSRDRDRRIRFSGSWSVLLRGAGFHANHVHPQGWVSSALYVTLPEHAADSDPRAGWLALGGPPPGLGLDLAPTRFIKPQPGRLVLFPSWMWHGTVPFPAGERLTVAFDVAGPR